MFDQSRMNFVFEEDYPIVETAQGKLHGFVDGDVFTFRGIDYAWADRFHLPVPPKPWDGVKDAVSYGFTCPEMNKRLKNPLDDDLLYPRRNGHINEHCQNLNIWSRSMDSDAKRPVMFFIHGGGYATGSSINSYSFDGWELAHNYDVVSVSINHRLNVFGFLDLSDYGDEYADSANLSIADMVAALKWVKENIAQFGGDPDNVTIFGQSGGGGKVMMLLQCPEADGLFHKAILQSGGASERITAVPNQKEVTAALVAELGLTRETIQQIESVELEKLQRATIKVYDQMGLSAFRTWAPKVDGKYYVGSAAQVGFRKENAKVPMMVGACLAEFDRSPKGRKADWTDEMRREVVEARFGGKVDVDVVMAAFKEAYPELDASYAACIDLDMRPSIVKFLDRRCAMTDAPVYNYVFAFETAMYGGMLPGHGGDLHVMFHNALYIEGMFREGITEQLQDDMAGAWAQFAYSGNPNRADLPCWPAYDPETRNCMVYGSSTGVRQNHDRKLLELLKDVKEPQFVPQTNNTAI